MTTKIDVEGMIGALLLVLSMSSNPARIVICSEGDQYVVDVMVTDGVETDRVQRATGKTLGDALVSLLMTLAKDEPGPMAN